MIRGHTERAEPHGRHLRTFSCYSPTIGDVPRTTSSTGASAAPGRGRPKLHSDEAILEAALRLFATHGYDGTSLRSLNRELGLSHSAI
ncbi:MAG: TetR/AcrR family transcriptional regulator, partial [Acidobacteria bacterium]|nr:TetR/AcrR family transcriptional regulator [Acidobacteriota bacterium]